MIDTANAILRPMAEGGMLTPRVIDEGLTKANQLAATVRPQSQQGKVRVTSVSGHAWFGLLLYNYLFCDDMILQIYQ